MGTWGAGIFQNDFAKDIRADFRDYVALGSSPKEVTERLESEYLVGGVDPIEFWLPLAAAQIECGRLTDRVKSVALSIIDSGNEALEWLDADEPLRARRSDALATLRDQLTGPQKSPVRLRTPHTQTTSWQRGDAVSYRLDSGQLVIFVILGVEKLRLDQVPIGALLDWSGHTPPDQTSLLQLLKQYLEHPLPLRKLALTYHKDAEFPVDRLNVVATGIEIGPPDPRFGLFSTWMGGWEEMDEYLVAEFGLR